MPATTGTPEATTRLRSATCHGARRYGRGASTRGRRNAEILDATTGSDQMRVWSEGAGVRVQGGLATEMGVQDA